MTDVSIIIVNYNTLEKTKDCIYSIIEKTSGVSFEIIVVDNASKDGSQNFFCRDERIRYIYNEENLGFGKANNVGIINARGRNIFFLNSDTVLCNNAVKILSDFLDNREDAGACGGNLFDIMKNPTHSYKKDFYSVWTEINNLLHYIPARIHKDINEQFNFSGRPMAVAYITGADLMVPKKILDEVGCFNPRFFMYFEEEELCYRISKAGYKIYSNPEAEIIHLEGGSTKGPRALHDNKLFQESRKIFLEEVYGEKYERIVNFLHSDKVQKLFLVKNLQ